MIFSSGRRSPPALGCSRFDSTRSSKLQPPAVMEGEAMVRRSFLFGLGIVASATLMLEIVLTRVFSVIMWYHMSLVAVSMAMFGMTVGALVVHRRPEWFRPADVGRACSRSALWVGVS